MNDLEDARRDHDVPAPRGRPRLQLRLRALPHAGDGATCSAPSAGPTATTIEPVPFSRQFVRHIAGWYAQKHPDEDFAETFAVWLTPRSSWRERYKGWGAMTKLRYVDRMAAKLRATRACASRRATPTSRSRRWRRPSRTSTSRRSSEQRSRSTSPSTPTCATSSASRKRAEEGRAPAADLLSENRKALIDKVTYWTGVQRPLVKRSSKSIETRVGELGLRADVKCEKENLTEVDGVHDGAGDELPHAGKVRAALIGWREDGRGA